MSNARVSTWVEAGTDRLRGAAGGQRDRRIVGLDLGPTSRRARPNARLAAPLLAIAILAALGLAALRTDVLRTGYALTEAHREELRLREELRSLSVSMQQLRAPAALQTRARELGFARPERVIELEAPNAAATAPPPTASTMASGQAVMSAANSPGPKP